MLILALDTATEKGSLALMAGDRVLMEYSLESPNAYLTCLMPGVAAILKNTGKELADLGAVAVSTGPGNFTGLRIGLATAKTLAWSLKCPLAPVPTLEVLAAQFPFHPHPIGVVMDARRGEVFWGLFRCPEDWPQVLEGPLRLPVRELPARLPRPLLLTGPGLEVYRELLTALLPPEIAWAPPDRRWPRASTLARLARRRLEQGLTANPAQLAPTYLRPAL
ncbi:MAG: tRNA (adenosine(37)-N6)-threonylcarbamoyltransferase complex dimerization subunit type 1 TsaB [Deltaproteobacteria bacterium CG07_land_8_20_14_0_80_60_11]|nr:MAG: tRNA (adenosine(37)-N6)-threonylcarbamoyltransferase complex dimerization subunit type 1 TsaB [Deltaproteobacteria bacterium CG07_land_8_20_14_0_80_60_11]